MISDTKSAKLNLWASSMHIQAPAGPQLKDMCINIKCGALSQSLARMTTLHEYFNPQLLHFLSFFHFLPSLDTRTLPRSSLLYSKTPPCHHN